MNPDLRQFGLQVRDLRLAQELSQEDLAELSGLHRTYIGGVERGERNVGLRNILKLASALGVPVAHLFPIRQQRAPELPATARRGTR